jgi:hypothetical protein
MKSMPSTSIEYVRWARDVMPRLVSDRALTRGEGLMLKELASRADRCGGCFASPATLGAGIGVGGRQAQRLLGGLRDKKLVHVAARGRGCVRTLQPAVVPDLLSGQLSFDDLLDGTLPAPVQHAAVSPEPGPVRAAGAARPMTSVSGPATSGCRTKEVKEELLEEGGARCARDCRPDLRELGVPERRAVALEPRLTAVLTALSSAPNLLVEPLNVNAALAAHPEVKGHDHLCAALTLVSLALGETRSTVAHARLLGVLQKQRAGAPALSRASGRPPHEGRARRAAASPAVSYMRED